MRTNHQNFSNSKRNFAPTAVLTKSANGKRVISVVGKQWNNAVKSSACWIWRPTGKVIDYVSKDSGSYICKKFEYGDPQVALKDTGIFDSGCLIPKA
ncbi:hypothetical protein Tco_1169270 [Tanacetum coccineum]